MIGKTMWRGTGHGYGVMLDDKDPTLWQTWRTESSATSGKYLQFMWHWWTGIDAMLNPSSSVPHYYGSMGFLNNGTMYNDMNSTPENMETHGQASDNVTQRPSTNALQSSSTSSHSSLSDEEPDSSYFGKL